MIIIPSPLTDVDLSRRYKQFRRQYYIMHGLQMPANCVLRFAPIDDPEWEKYPNHPLEAEWCTEDGQEFFITLQPYVANHYCAAKVALLHEMAHIHVYFNTLGDRRFRKHGPTFQAEIDRLYRLGAYRKLL